MNITQALSWLDSLINYEKGFQKYRQSHYQVDILARLLDQEYPGWQDIPLVHIAGTKGKGSIARYIAFGLSLAGKKAGLFTSPHYFTLNERISINKHSIPDKDLGLLISREKNNITKHQLTYFEALTYLSMVYFVEQGCDAIIMETGMGGRLDSTNFHPAPAVTLISAISYDHTAVLGSTLALIAGEKAGIIKKGVPVICTAQQPEALEVIQQKADQHQSPWYYIPQVMPCEVLNRSGTGSTISSAGDIALPGTVKVRQWGDAYIESFSAAVVALKVMGITLDGGNIRKMADLQFPFHIHKSANVILDVSHNAASIELLFRTILDYAHIERFRLALGILADKELVGIVDMICQYQQNIIDITVFEIPKASRPGGGQALYELLQDTDIAVQYVADFANINIEADTLMVVTGSFYSIPVVAPCLGFPLDATL